MLTFDELLCVVKLCHHCLEHQYTIMFIVPYLLLGNILFRNAGAYVSPFSTLSRQQSKKTSRIDRYFRESSSNRCKNYIPLKSTESKSSESPSPTSQYKPNAWIAIINFFGIHEVFKQLFLRYSVAFPASLSGCGTLLTTFLLAPMGNDLYAQFAPGATVLAKWLPVFFVPSLISLPLANSVGSSTEVSITESTHNVGNGLPFTLLSCLASQNCSSRCWGIFL
jgi:putative effector of murein hydrolase LrgA (UPF0299 family)